MQIDYPAGAWRIYVVDDASTDHTPDVMREKMAQYPGSVFHLRREKGGQGKAHTLNHGIRAILDDNWAEAVMIMDADVLFEPLTLRRMVRHLADPEIGGVTAYVKEGSMPASLLSRFIAFEYITAQAAARRAQNVMGALVCMAGGAQLHSRENLQAIGGAIDTSTLAEDTYTTFKTQLGRAARVDRRQRHRMGRGTRQRSGPVEATPALEPRQPADHDGLSSSVVHQRPACRLGRRALRRSVVQRGSDAIVHDPGRGGIGRSLFPVGPWAEKAFAFFWSATFVIYLSETLFCFAIDPVASRKCWFEGVIFPGLVSLAMMASRSRA